MEYIPSFGLHSTVHPGLVAQQRVIDHVTRFSVSDYATSQSVKDRRAIFESIRLMSGHHLCRTCAVAAGNDVTKKNARACMDVHRLRREDFDRWGFTPGHLYIPQQQQQQQVAVVVTSCKALFIASHPSSSTSWDADNEIQRRLGGWTPTSLTTFIDSFVSRRCRQV